MKRREFLELGAAFGASALGGAACLTAPRSEMLRPVKDLAIELYRSLDETTRSKACVDYDHPMRQYHNRGVTLAGPGADVGLGAFSWSQLRLLNQLFYAGLSDAGRDLVPKQQFLSFGGVRLLKVLFLGDPSTSWFQVIFSGPHVNLRLGGRSREDVAFGGPLVYGDQRGNYRQGLPGNVYRHQFSLANELLSLMTPDQRRRAIRETSPVQTRIELRGAKGSFEGMPIRECSPRAQDRLVDLVRAILLAYPAEDVDYAWSYLEGPGGIEAMHASYYRDGEVDGSGEYQIFRLESPSAVLHFRGFPHVHAFINIGKDGERPLSVGAELGENPTPLEGSAVKGLFEAAMRESARTELSYYPAASVVGGLRAGLIREGDVYDLESWGESIRVVTVRGRRLAGRAAAEWRGAGANIDVERTLRIATTSYVADEKLRESFGEAAVVETGELLRDAAIRYLRAHGFPVGSHRS